MGEECFINQKEKLEIHKNKEMPELVEIGNDDGNDKQMYCALSFCVMLVLIGIPLWWKTTEVYRVSLPYSEMDALPDLNVRIEMMIHIVTADETRGTDILNGLRAFFNESGLYKINFKAYITDGNVVDSRKTLDEIEKKIKHPKIEGTLQLFEIPHLRNLKLKNVVIGHHRTVYFSSDADASDLFDFLRVNILREDALLDTISQINLPSRKDMNVKHKMPPSDDYDILFTILNPEPDFLDIRFDIKQGIEEYVRPFLKIMEDMNGFHVKSQWLHFVPLQIHPKFLNTSERGPHFALSQDLLPHIITPLEKKLASHVSKHPCLNFVLYITPCSLSPLKIYTKKGFPVRGADAFISPRWGGIQIHNPDRESCLRNEKVSVEPDRHIIMTIFVKQMKMLLGISESDSNEEKQVEEASAYLQQWEKDSLLRIRTVEQLTFAKLTVQSLSKLLGKISNIVINDHVGDAVCSALANIYEATKALDRGNLTEAYDKSKRAFLSSEKAFMDPSLLALLYFPDDQKYAVYIPLFLPIMIPILISFKYIKQWVEKKLKMVKVKTS